MKLQTKQLETAAWSLSGLSILLAFIAWGQSYNWEFNTLYQLFPIFGLIAFSIMWSQYVITAIKLYFGLNSPRLRSYFEATSIVVLVAILLHPGLLSYQLFVDGLGLPSGSYYEYVGSMMKISVILGQIALIIFLAFELKLFFKGKPWLRYVLMASDLGMVLVYIHALRLGGQLQDGWFRGVWIFYGITLSAVLGYIYWRRLKRVRMSQRPVPIAK